jgi:AcrR family transcriptional regulator
MGIAERREREKELLRHRIIEAGRDLLSEQGLAGLSMRAIADRIEYSPASIYSYFKDKDELVREIVHAGFAHLSEYMAAEIEATGAGATAAARYCASGLAYGRFALENTAYFRVMFELPGAAHVECPAECGPGDEAGGEGFRQVVALVEQAHAEGSIEVADAERTALTGWGLVHGLTSLYLSGHLAPAVGTHEAFLALIEDSMRSMMHGWGARQETPASMRPEGASRERKHA